MDRLRLKRSTARRMLKLKFLAVGLLLAALVLVFLDSPLYVWPCLWGCLLMLLHHLLERKYFRCPHCKGETLSPQWSQEPASRRRYCPGCGWPVLYDDELDKYPDDPPEDRGWYRRHR